MTPPRPRPRSPAVFWLGCLSVFFLVSLVVVGGTMFWMLRRNAAPRRTPTALPAAWRDSIRAWAQLPPDVAALAPARTDTGNAWRALRQLEPLPAAWGLLQRKLELGRDLDGADSAALALVRSDHRLDSAAAAATLRTWSWAGSLAGFEGRNGPLGLGIPERPNLLNASRAPRGLALRAYLNARDGRREAAARDLRAAMGLSAMMYERGTGWWQAASTRQVVRDVARQLAAVAGPRDTTTARAAERVAEWAGRGRRSVPFLFFDLSQSPDTALEAAADQTLPLPFRADMLWQAALGSVFDTPWHAVRGPREDLIARVRRLERDPDPDLAALATAADTALARIRRVGWWRRTRLVLRALER